MPIGDFIALIVVWLIGTIVGLAILHWLVSNAIHSSELARDIREIKELLKRQYAAGPDGTGGEPSGDEGEADGTGGDAEACPGCGARVRPTDEVCPSCGLTLIAQDDGEKE
jgi:hypothetical protein